MINETTQSTGAGSSKLSPSSIVNGQQPGLSKRRRKAKKDAIGNVNGGISTEIEQFQESRRKLENEYGRGDPSNRPKKRQRKIRPDGQEISIWECIPLSRNEVLRIPPVWSRDGR